MFLSIRGLTWLLFCLLYRLHLVTLGDNALPLVELFKYVITRRHIINIFVPRSRNDITYCKPKRWIELKEASYKLSKVFAEKASRLVLRMCYPEQIVSILIDQTVKWISWECL